MNIDQIALDTMRNIQNLNEAEFCSDTQRNSRIQLVIIEAINRAMAGNKQLLANALEREQALAAHVENVKRLIREWRNGEMGDVAAAMALEDWRVSIQTAASLARRDRIKQAEALEEAYKHTDDAAAQDYLHDVAAELRQQAEALK